MARFNPYDLSSDERNKLLNEFFIAIAALDNFKEVRDFFKDLLSESESVMLARRLKIARMLIEGLNHDEIRQKLGVGYDNINMVNRWLKFGRNGYINAIKKLEKLQAAKKREFVSEEEKANPFSWYNIKHRYPLYFWPEGLVSKLDKIILDYLRINKKYKSLKKFINAND